MLGSLLCLEHLSSKEMLRFLMILLFHPCFGLRAKVSYLVRLGLGLVVILSLSGCSTFNNSMAKVIHELAQDTNTVRIRITSPTFGTFELDRNAPVITTFDLGK